MGGMFEPLPAMTERITGLPLHGPLQNLRAAPDLARTGGF